MKLRLALATLALLFAAACGAQESGRPTPTATPAPTAAASATPTTPAGTLTLSPGVIPPNLPFPFTPGHPIPAIVRDVVIATTTANIDGLAALATLQQVACTTAPGAGGPPKCKPNEAAGTVTSMFPTGTCQGEWVADPKAALTSLLAQPVQLYAATEVKAPTPDPEPYWPKGQYVVMFTGASGANPPGIYFVLDATSIVRAHAICGSGFGTETNLLRQLGTVAFLIPPGR